MQAADAGEGSAEVSFFRDNLQPQFAALLRGELPLAVDRTLQQVMRVLRSTCRNRGLTGSPDWRAWPAQAQLLGEGGGDATRLPDAQLSLDVAAELAPPPFDEYLQR